MTRNDARWNPPAVTAHTRNRLGGLDRMYDLIRVPTILPRSNTGWG